MTAHPVAGNAAPLSCPDMTLPRVALATLLFVACADDKDPALTTSPTFLTSASASNNTSASEPTSEASDADTGATPADSTSDATSNDSTSDATSDGPTSDPTTNDPSASTPGTSEGPDPTLPDDTTDPTNDPGTDTTDTDGDGVVPPLGGSSMGMGGGGAAGDVKMTGTGVTYRLIAPGTPGKTCAFIVYSGVEGGQLMTQNLLMTADFTGNGDCIFAVLDGKDYNGDGQAGADVLDDVRGEYDVDNDRTYLLSESAGTTAGLELGLQLRQSYFAAYWANDVNAAANPQLSSAELGFQPWGNAGPGGQFATANAIVDGMTAAGYRIEQPAPYDGPGAETHGDTNQFLAALQWFPGRSRQ